VTINSSTNWGGTVYCFQASGASGTTLQIISGKDAGSPYFDPTVASKRIVSIAIETWPLGSGGVNIDVLRGDGTLFYAPVSWPTPHPSSEYNFYPVPGPLPPSPRDIAFVYGHGLVVTDTSNQQWVQLDRDHNYQWQRISDHIVLVAGNQVSGQSIALYGTTGTSTQIGRFYGTQSPPSLPSGIGTLIYGQTDPNLSFSVYGRMHPLAIGPNDAWAIMSPSYCNLPAGSTFYFQPCLLRSTLGSSGWSSWAGFRTDGAYYSDIIPFSIQDGYAMRQRRGEIWVIDSNARLVTWIPA